MKPPDTSFTGRTPRARRRVTLAPLGTALALCALATAAGAAQPGTMWMSPAQLAALPTAGPAWAQVLAVADAGAPTPDINLATNTHNLYVLASALVAARLGLTGAGATYRATAASELLAVVDSEPGTSARDPAVNLQPYAIAADLIDLADLDPAAELSLRRWFTDVRYVCFGIHSFWTASEERPNNWGLANIAARLALAIYLDEHGGAPAATCATAGACNPPEALAACADPAAEIARVATVFQGWLGARELYAGFRYRQLWWQADPEQPVGINPAGSTIEGQDVDGVLPDDQRRSGKFRLPFRKENYAWEALQSVLVIAVLLDRRGYDVWRWQDHAIKRALDWLHRPHFAPSGIEPYAAAGDDVWQPHVYNYFYGSAFPAAVPARHGKNMGWTDWTHATGSAAALGCPQPCDDGDVCNGYEFCDGNTCRPGRSAVCDDANPCTDDACDATEGCTSTPVEAGCDDGDACNGIDQCVDGNCVAGEPPDCNDGNPCTDDACNASFGCVHASNRASCSDDDACNGEERCSASECRAGTPLECDDGNPCTLDMCSVLTGCLHEHVTGNCDDGNACTTGDACEAGMCVGVAMPHCTTTTTATPPLCGDANGDRQITVADVLQVLSTANGTATCDLEVCDVDGSMTITPTDALTILRFVVGEIEVLICA